MILSVATLRKPLPLTLCMQTSKTPTHKPFVRRIRSVMRVNNTRLSLCYPFYNPYDDAVYLMGKGTCIRKLVDDQDGTYSVSLISGDCTTRSFVDGANPTGKHGALLGSAADGAGNIWTVENNGSTVEIRKVDVNGVISSPTISRTDGGTRAASILNSPYVHEVMSPGRDTTSVHLADSRA